MNKDITGQKFGLLVAIEKHPVSCASGSRWVCLCECGNTKVVAASNLKSGNTKSCGCAKRQLKNDTKNLICPPKDLKGKVYGKLTVLRKSERRSGSNPMWECLCECGTITTVIQENLLNGHTKSCGCYSSRNTIGERSLTHGKSNTRLYYVWRTMIARCENPSVESYPYYGERGIQVCDEWKDFQSFFDWAMSNGYNANAKFGDCTIDRIDVDGDYCPANCRWVDMKVQNKNKRGMNYIARQSIRSARKHRPKQT